MKIDKINNLVELFHANIYETQNKDDIFLQSLKEPIENKYSWEEVYINIIKLSEEISKSYKKR